MVHSIKGFLRKAVIRSRLINWLYVYIMRLRFVAKNRKLNFQRKPLVGISHIDDYALLYPCDRVVDNNYFGISTSLKTYAGIKGSLDAYIEHGLFLGSLVKEDSYRWKVRRIITFSDDRRGKIQKKTDREVIAIGPYIHYAAPFLSESELEDLKRRYGKILLVMPAHSVSHASLVYDRKWLADRIESIRKQYDSVFVCLFYLDALNKEYADFYEKCGYQVVSAGSRYDPSFLSRLKSLILLSSYVVSNEVGTHVGYINYLNRPLTVWDQLKELQITSRKRYEAELRQRNEEDWITYYQEREVILKAFADYKSEIDANQKAVVNHFWGTSSIRSPKELADLLRD